MDIDASFVPSLTDDISFVKFNDSKYTVCIENGQSIKLNIGLATKILLDKIDGRRNVEELTHLLNDDLGTKFDVNDTLKVFKTQLIGYGIFHDDNGRKIKGMDNYLKLRFIILPANWVKVMASQLTFLFEKYMFWWSLLLGTLYVTGVYFSKLSPVELYNSADANFLYISFAIVGLSILLHELGHAAACVKYGAKPGAIGFGFFLIMPSFYADVTDSWRLTRHQRLIVDLGGVYMQLWCCIILCIIFQVTGDIMYLNVSTAIAVLLLINVNPFLRFDGYWIVSDITNIPNLREKAKLALRQVYLFFTNQNPTWKNDAQTWFLTTYGIMRVGFFVFFIFYIVIVRRSSIVTFPYDLFQLFHTIITNFESITFDWLKASIGKLFIPLVFYIMVFRLVKQKILNRRKNQS